MSDEIKAKFSLVAEAWNTGNLDLLDEFLAANGVYHMAPFPDMNSEALKQFIMGFRKAFPDFHVTIHEDIIAGNRSGHLWTWSATFAGESPLLPVAPTGKRTGGPGSHIVHWEGGKAIEAWHFGDWLGALQQAGVIPPMG